MPDEVYLRDALARRHVGVRTHDDEAGEASSELEPHSATHMWRYSSAAVQARPPEA